MSHKVSYIHMGYHGYCLVIIPGVSVVKDITNTCRIYIGFFILVLTIT